MDTHPTTEESPDPTVEELIQRLREERLLRQEERIDHKREMAQAEALYYLVRQLAVLLGLIIATYLSTVLLRT